MVLTAAERQAIYRTKYSTVGDNGERKLNAWINTAAALALKRQEADRSQKRIQSAKKISYEEAVKVSLRKY